MVRSGEELAGDLEGRQSDLSVLLVELRHHRVVHVLDAVIRRSGRNTQQLSEPAHSQYCMVELTITVSDILADLLDFLHLVLVELWLS